MRNMTLFDTEIDYQAQEDLKENIWTTSIGEEVHITDMTNHHINNTIKWLKSNSDFYQSEEWIEVFEEELERQGDEIEDELNF